MRQKYPTSLQVSTSHITVFERVISAEYYLLWKQTWIMFASQVSFFLASTLLTEIRHYSKTNQGTHAYPLDPDLQRPRHRILEHKGDKKNWEISGKCSKEVLFLYRVKEVKPFWRNCYWQTNLTGNNFLSGKTAFN